MEFYITRDDNYLAHHGIKGMKWGVRKDNYGSGGKIQRKAKRDAIKEYNKNNKITKKYIAASRKVNSMVNNPVKNPYYKETVVSNKRLTEKVENYLSTLNKSTVKNLIKRDSLYDEYYVDERMFNKKAALGDGISITDEFAKKYV